MVINSAHYKLFKQRYETFLRKVIGVPCMANFRSGKVIEVPRLTLKVVQHLLG